MNKDFPKRGGIYFVSLEPTVGSEIGKSRPALVISNDRNNEFSETITVIPITSNVQKIYPFETFISKDDKLLEVDSKAKCNQIRTIDKRRLIRFLGKLPESKIRDIENSLKIHLGFGIE